MKPILFNTDMVRAILKGRKTVTRQLVKPQPKGPLVPTLPGGCWPGYFEEVGTSRVQRPPYRPGDILYVRETWTVWNGNYEYKADVDDGYGPFCSNCTLDICAGDCNSILKWHPSIHMPREAARIFLRVTDVRVKRLQNMTEADAFAEGFEAIVCNHPCDIPCTDCMNTGYLESAMFGFVDMWNSTIKPADRALYGWEANPWVWVIEFERISREEARRDA